MKGSQKNVVWFEEVGKDDVSLAGGKGASLGQMVRFQIPVPPGFIVTANAYFNFIQRMGLQEEIYQFLKSLDINNSQLLQEVASKVKERILSIPMPSEIALEIKQAYKKFGSDLVAVRSSATAEDLPEASFAGQQRTFLNVLGEEEVVKAVQGCWASLFEPRAIFYRRQYGFEDCKVGIAVVVQKMVHSEVSGVMFTAEPLTKNKTKILIEAVYGLGESVVSGEVTPDLYLVDKSGLKIVDKRIGKQEWQVIGNPSALTLDETNLRVQVERAKQLQQKLVDEEIIALAKLGKDIEELYQFPQDIEWAKEGEQLFIVQSRPITTLGKVLEAEAFPEIKGEVLFSGIAASPGIAWGQVRIIHEASEINRVEVGDILVTRMTTPDFVPAMKRAAAIVTDSGGRTAHAAIVSRELGIPCVVGTKIATEFLSDGQEITVDGFRGLIYRDRVIKEKFSVPVLITGERIKTKTKVYVNLAEPELAETVAARNVDGVGLLRAEFMMAQIGEHPQFILHQNRGSEFVDRLARDMAIFARAFNPRPVVYRTSDFKTNEYRGLRGGQKYEEIEENPMIGYRGCSRYIQEIEALKLEIQAIKKVRQDYDNLWVMFPFVRLTSELVEIKKIFEAEGLCSSPNFKLWMMVEVPSNVFLIEEFLACGIDGISIGSNDLTQLILGIDRDNAKLARLFDERNEAVLMAMEKVIKVANSHNVTSSICGQAPSIYPELTEKLVRWGVTSVSINPDMIDETRRIIAYVEAKLKR